MATMVASTKTVTTKGTGSGSKFPGPNGNGSKGHKGEDFLEPDSRANRYRIGMWVALASIAMMFTALSSAYIVRAASANDWIPLSMPRILLLSTGLLIISSGTLETSKRKLKSALLGAHKRWLILTVILGLGFLGSQLLAWRHLAKQGVYLASNPHSSFFYLMTAMHGLHLAGGLFALSFLLVRTWKHETENKVSPRHQAAADAVTVYWHFMDGLWIYLFLLLFLWR
jgi:cytochrome c oxidase subunit III